MEKEFSSFQYRGYTVRGDPKGGFIAHKGLKTIPLHKTTAREVVSMIDSTIEEGELIGRFLNLELYQGRNRYGRETYTAKGAFFLRRTAPTLAALLLLLEKERVFDPGDDLAAHLAAARCDTPKAETLRKDISGGFSFAPEAGKPFGGTNGEPPLAPKDRTILDGPVLGQEAYGPDGLGRVVAFKINHTDDDWIDVESYVFKKTRRWGYRTVRLVPLTLTKAR